MTQPKPLVFSSKSDFDLAWSQPQRGDFGFLVPQCLEAQLKRAGHAASASTAGAAFPGEVTAAAAYHVPPGLCPVERLVTTTPAEGICGVTAEYAATLRGQAVTVSLVDLSRNPDMVPKSGETVANLATTDPCDYPSDFDQDGNPDLKFGYIHGPDGKPQYALGIERE